MELLGVGKLVGVGKRGVFELQGKLGKLLMLLLGGGGGGIGFEF